MSTLKYSVVDAFTTSPFKGNSAAVIVLDEKSPALDDKLLQQIAAEFNLAETAFVTPVDREQGQFALRWFTPTIEIAICGHATLASASVLLSSNHLPKGIEKVEFATLSGTLSASLLQDGRIELEFPAGEATPADDELQNKVVDVVHRAFIGDSQPNVHFVGIGHGISFHKYMLIDVDGVDLKEASVQPAIFGDLAPAHSIIIVTQQGRFPGEVFASRVFAPAIGVPEDPVCGSAHCMLGPYWAEKLQLDHTAEMRAKQVSARSGDVGVVWDREKSRCRLRGHATMTAQGTLYLG